MEASTAPFSVWEEGPEHPALWDSLLPAISLKTLDEALILFPGGVLPAGDNEGEVSPVTLRA